MPILLYDGVCGLCNRFVQFVLRHDHRATFRFASLQSPLANKILAHHNLNPTQQNTVYVVVNPADESTQPTPREYLITRSAAVIFILQELRGPWPAAASLLRILPLALRDLAYNTLARHRYKIFGRSQVCALPPAQYRDRFLDI